MERGEIQAGPGDADLAGNRAAEVAEVGVECEGGGVVPSPQRDPGARHLEQTGLERRRSELGATGVGREHGLETVETKPLESAAGHLEEGSVGLDPCDRERLELGQQCAPAHLQALDHRLVETVHLQATDPDLAPKPLRQRALDSEAGEVAGQPEAGGHEGCDDQEADADMPQAESHLNRWYSDRSAGCDHAVRETPGSAHPSAPGSDEESPQCGLPFVDSLWPRRPLAPSHPLLVRC